MHKSFPLALYSFCDAFLNRSLSEICWNFVYVLFWKMELKTGCPDCYHDSMPKGFQVTAGVSSGNMRITWCYMNMSKHIHLYLIYVLSLLVCTRVRVPLNAVFVVRLLVLNCSDLDLGCLSLHPHGRQSSSPDCYLSLSFLSSRKIS